jgi:hypothetical protein
MSKKLQKRALQWCSDAIGNEAAFVEEENPDNLSPAQLQSLVDYISQIASTLETSV